MEAHQLCGLLVPIVRVVYVKKIDLNRQFVVKQSLKLGVRQHSIPYLFLEICLRFIVNVQLSLQDLSFLLRFLVEVYFGSKQPFSHRDQFACSRQTAIVKVGSVLYFTQRRIESLLLQLKKLRIIVLYFQWRCAYHGQHLWGQLSRLLGVQPKLKPAHPHDYRQSTAPF